MASLIVTIRSASLTAGYRGSRWRLAATAPRDGLGKSETFGLPGNPVDAADKRREPAPGVLLC